jgi:hypothetical protein
LQQGPATRFPIRNTSHHEIRMISRFPASRSPA